MTARQLIERLAQFDSDLEVVIGLDGGTEIDGVIATTPPGLEDDDDVIVLVTK